ncbi:MAG: transposase family protein [Deinococcota bacterium]|jgi:hypothetical protein|nr:transposase family protein [Deinococcota bacterium]
MSSAEKVILFVGQTFSGRSHDYTLLKAEFPPQEAWFADIEAILDSGYQGVQKDYQGERIRIPHKKPRKSKKNPKPHFSREQKQENRALAKLRIFKVPCFSGY